MTPFTELLEHFARLLPEVGGVCINAESELEAVGMAWGALATGARAATGSTGQGLSLMQESFSEITLAELPLVIFNMARGQQDYFQATRGGGHGDYRHIVLAPQDVARRRRSTCSSRSTSPTSGATRCSSTATTCSRTRRKRSRSSRIEFPDLPPKDWAVDGTASGSGRVEVGHAARRRQARPARARPGRQVAVHRDEDAAHGATRCASRPASSTMPRR